MSAVSNFAPLTQVVDVLLADIAVRIQLSATNHSLAVQRYDAIQRWIERDGSPLQGLVQLFYPQGSMSIGATIATKLEVEEFDIDLIAQVTVPATAAPGWVLDQLYAAIRGEPGSRYYDMTTRCTRCVQVTYADNMHLDVTPMVRFHHRPEREGIIFHARENGPHPGDGVVAANPYGFAEWFKAQTPADRAFARAFAARAQRFDRLVAAAKAEAEPVPAQTEAHEKSIAVIVLQLIKRWRNLRYAYRPGRCPASVLLARLVADAGNQSQSLFEALLFQVRYMHALIDDAKRHGRLLDIRNPVCEADDFTDRWPANQGDQDLFLRDLADLITKLERLGSGCTLATMHEILADLFGERSAADAIATFNRDAGQATVERRSFHDTRGGRLDLAASGVVAAVGSLASPAVRATPAHTHFGGGFETT